MHAILAAIILCLITFQIIRFDEIQRLVLFSGCPTKQSTLCGKTQSWPPKWHKAEQRYWELFTADKMVSSYVDLYKELIHTKV